MESEDKEIKLKKNSSKGIVYAARVLGLIVLVLGFILAVKLGSMKLLPGITSEVIIFSLESHPFLS